MKIKLTIAILMLVGVAWGQVVTGKMDQVEDKEKTKAMDTVNDTNTSSTGDITVAIPTNSPVGDAMLDPTRGLIIGSNIIVTARGIRHLAKSGAICEVYGHCWVYPLYKDNGMPAWDKIRKCKLCGKVEIKEEEWK